MVVVVVVVEVVVVEVVDVLLVPGAVEPVVTLSAAVVLVLGGWVVVGVTVVGVEVVSGTVVEEGCWSGTSPESPPQAVIRAASTASTKSLRIGWDFMAVGGLGLTFQFLHLVPPMRETSWSSSPGPVKTPLRCPGPGTSTSRMVPSVG